MRPGRGLVSKPAIFSFKEKNCGGYRKNESFPPANNSQMLGGTQSYCRSSSLRKIMNRPLSYVACFMRLKANKHYKGISPSDPARFPCPCERISSVPPPPPDFTKRHESVALDSVYIKAAPNGATGGSISSSSPLPICAQGSPEATVCTC